MSGGGVGDAVKLDTAISELIRRSTDGGEPDHYVIVARLAMAAVEQLPCVDHAGVTLFGASGVIRSLAATDGDALVLDNIQRHCGEGPGYQCAADHRVVRVGDLTVELRWRTFVEQMLPLTAIRSILAFPLPAGDEGSAALTLCADRPGELEGDVEEAGSVFAEHVARCLEAGRNRSTMRYHVDFVGARSPHVEQQAC